MTDIFNSPERAQFFQSIDFPWYDLPPTNQPQGSATTYALYHCDRVSPDTVAKLRQASEAVGIVLMETWELLREFHADDLEYYGFPIETIELIQFDELPPWCMRLDWCWNPQTETYRVIEVNSQTPSFWYEPTVGNNLVAPHFGLQPIENYPTRMLQQSLSDLLQRAAKDLDKPLNSCRIGLTALNNPEDLNTMRWLSRNINIDRCRNLDIFGIENLRLDNNRCVYNAANREPIDILFLWYPIEWLLSDTDEDGEYLYPDLLDLIFEQKIVIVNFGSAFALQSKGIFALIQDLGLSVFSDDAAAAILDYFPKTAMSPADIGTSYFAKPVFGRQGEGAYAMVDGIRTFTGNVADSYYTEQPYIYQELLEFPTVEIAETEMTELWGVWLYNNGRDRLIADAVGKRLSIGKVTDDGAYWCPIGY
jgi:glutathionylspermidine synthase